VIWKKSRLTTWTADGGFRIVEVPDAELPFSLTSRDADPLYFPTIEQAKAVAELRNRLALAEEDNARLRSELDGRKPRSALHRAFIADQDADAAEQDARDAWQEANDTAEPPDLRINYEPA
jgi:hypothetical protein